MSLRLVVLWVAVAALAHLPGAYAQATAGSIQIDVARPSVDLAPGENVTIPVVVNVSLGVALVSGLCPAPSSSTGTFTVAYSVVTDTVRDPFLHVSFERPSDTFDQKCERVSKFNNITIALDQEADKGLHNFTLKASSCSDEASCATNSCGPGCRMQPATKAMAANATEAGARLRPASLAGDGGAAVGAASLPWYRSPLAPENIPNTLQVTGALVAASTFVAGVVLVRRRRSILRDLLDEVDELAREHATDAAALRDALAGVEARCHEFVTRGKIDEKQHAIVTRRIDGALRGRLEPPLNP